MKSSTYLFSMAISTISFRLHALKTSRSFSGPPPLIRYWNSSRLLWRFFISAQVPFMWLFFRYVIKLSIHYRRLSLLFLSAFQSLVYIWKVPMILSLWIHFGFITVITHHAYYDWFSSFGLGVINNAILSRIRLNITLFLFDINCHFHLADSVFSQEVPE